MFDARAAKQLQPGTHLTIEGCPGLRLQATARTRAWTYRYKSPVDRRMRQVKLGEWPAMSCPAATYTRSQAFALLERWAHAPVQAGKLRAELGAEGVAFLPRIQQLLNLMHGKGRAATSQAVRHSLVYQRLSDVAHGFTSPR